MNCSCQKFYLDTPTRHSTCLKNKVLAQIPNLQYFKKGKQGFMAFNSKITGLLHEDIGNNTDLEINRILLKHMFSGERCFNGSLKDPSVQPNSAPATLLKFSTYLMSGCDQNYYQYNHNQLYW